MKEVTRYFIIGIFASIYTGIFANDFVFQENLENNHPLKLYRYPKPTELNDLFNIDKNGRHPFTWEVQKDVAVEKKITLPFANILNKVNGIIESSYTGRKLVINNKSIGIQEIKKISYFNEDIKPEDDFDVKLIEFDSDTATFEINNKEEEIYFGEPKKELIHQSKKIGWVISPNGLVMIHSNKGDSSYISLYNRAIGKKFFRYIGNIGDIGFYKIGLKNTSNVPYIDKAIEEEIQYPVTLWNINKNQYTKNVFQDIKELNKNNQNYSGSIVIDKNLRIAGVVGYNGRNNYIIKINSLFKNDMLIDEDYVSEKYPTIHKFDPTLFSVIKFYN